jgi:hypothetical protein
MKNFFLACLIFVVYTAQAQDDAKASLRKYPVESTGCSVYLPAPPGEWTVEKSDDGSDVYTVAVLSDDLAFDVIAVQFLEPFSFLSREEQELLLISYLDFLKQQFKVNQSAGYGKGQILPGNDSAAGVLDYWEFDDGSKGKIKGWITETHLAVMLVTGSEDPDGNSVTNLFLDGFRFPEK